MFAIGSAARVAPRTARNAKRCGVSMHKMMMMTSHAQRKANGRARTRADATEDASASAMTSEVMIVTGANTGLGYETALAFAKSRRGGRLVIAVRDEARGERAKTRVLAAVPTAEVEVMVVDLADF